MSNNEWRNKKTFEDRISELENPGPDAGLFRVLAGIGVYIVVGLAMIAIVIVVLRAMLSGSP